VLAADWLELSIARAGIGPLLAELQEYARRLGVENHAEFLGFREDVADLYSRSRVFVLPSRNKGLSISLLDAMGERDARRRVRRRGSQRCDSARG
jgi:glycosyltransferase involved in cell wall biosynthesis